MLLFSSVAPISSEFGFWLKQTKQRLAPCCAASTLGLDVHKSHDLTIGRDGNCVENSSPEVFPRCQTGCFQESQGQPQLKRGATNIQNMSHGEKMKMFVGGLRVTGRLHHVNFNKWSTEFRSTSVCHQVTRTSAHASRGARSAFV